jgi:hypothetical protein
VVLAGLAAQAPPSATSVCGRPLPAGLRNLGTPVLAITHAQQIGRRRTSAAQFGPNVASMWLPNLSRESSAGSGGGQGATRCPAELSPQVIHTRRAHLSMEAASVMSSWWNTISPRPPFPAPAAPSPRTMSRTARAPARPSGHHADCQRGGHAGWSPRVCGQLRCHPVFALLLTTLWVPRREHDSEAAVDKLPAHLEANAAVAARHDGHARREARG